MPNAYTEDQLVEQPAIGLFAELGWAIAFGNPQPDSLPAGEGGIVDEMELLGRETKGEVVLVSRLRAALELLNKPTLPTESVNAAVDELTRDRSAMSLSVALASAEKAEK
jgi:type I restriction enzyme R subunit